MLAFLTNIYLYYICRLHAEHITLHMVELKRTRRISAGALRRILTEEGDIFRSTAYLDPHRIRGNLQGHIRSGENLSRGNFNPDPNRRRGYIQEQWRSGGGLYTDIAQPDRSSILNSNFNLGLQRNDISLIIAIIVEQISSR